MHCCRIHSKLPQLDRIDLSHAKLPPRNSSPRLDLFGQIIRNVEVKLRHSVVEISSGRFLDLQFDPHSGVPKHVDQRVEAELVDVSWSFRLSSVCSACVERRIVNLCGLAHCQAEEGGPFSLRALPKRCRGRAAPDNRIRGRNETGWREPFGGKREAQVFADACFERQDSDEIPVLVEQTAAT